jgi:hypothetical protein
MRLRATKLNLTSSSFIGGIPANPYMQFNSISGNSGDLVSTWIDIANGRNLTESGGIRPVIAVESGQNVINFAGSKRLKFTPPTSLSWAACSFHFLVKPVLPIGSSALLTTATGYTGDFFGPAWTTDNWIFNGAMTQGKPNNPIQNNVWQLISIVFSGSTFRFFLNGAEISAPSDNTVSGQPASKSTLSISEIGLGYWSSGDVPFNWRMAASLVYDRANTVSEIRSIRDYYRINMPIYQYSANSVVYICNSLGTGAFNVGGGTGQLGYRVGLTKNKAYDNYSASIGGITTPQMTERVVEHYSKLIVGATGTKVAFVWEGTNDFVLNSVSAATAYSNTVMLKNALKANGFDKVVIGKVIDRNAGGFQAFLTAYNALIDTNSADWDAIATPPATLTDAGSNSNATNFNVDRVHLTTAGTDLFVPFVRTAIESVLP